jgi:phosphate:Na+ symporter
VILIARATEVDQTMPEILSISGQLIGGLGLFLLAIRMITDGLRLAAGNKLRDLLGSWTRTPLRGVLAGMAITALVQSSSAVTVAAIGFVNAGLLNLYHALGVVYGTNIGTTVTGWLVAAMGFKFNVDLFALPFIGVGMFMRLGAAGSRLGSVGEAIAGFGLFFIGVQLLQGAFEGISFGGHLESVASSGLLGAALFLSFGFVMTALTQSSSAAIAVILTATTGGVLSLSAAAAMIIGANVGTTSTAALTVIGATPNAKRVAAAHIIFNVITAIVALALLPLLLWLVRQSGQMLGLQDIPAVTLALFHTVFNVLGVAMLLPFTALLTGFLGRRLQTEEELEGRPKHLDRSVAVAPALALDALTLELANIGVIARRAAKGSLSAELGSSRRLRNDHAAVLSLCNAVGAFVMQLQRTTLPEDVAESIARILRTSRYYSSATGLAVTIADTRSQLHTIDDADTAAALAAFKIETIELLDAADPQAEAFSNERLSQLLTDLEDRYQALKAMLLEPGAEGFVSIAAMSDQLEMSSRVRRMAEQIAKGGRYLFRLFTTAPQTASTPAETGDTSDVNGNNETPEHDGHGEPPP